MYRFLLVGLCISTISCHSDKSIQQEPLLSVNAQNLAASDVAGPVLPSEPYDMFLKLKEIEKDIYNFEVGMYLFNGAHYISPNAVRDFSGKFTIHFDDSEEIKLLDTLIETPRSVEEIDPHPFTNGTVNWVRENTKYNQKLQRTTNENFEVKGFIQFTIEPRCTLEKIQFTITNEAGVIRVEEFGC